MRTISNIIKETKKLGTESNKTYDFADGRNTLQIGNLNAKLVDNTVCHDENGMAYKEYCVFKLTPAIKEALATVVREAIDRTITHNVLIRMEETEGTICTWEGTRRNVPLLITVTYDPITHSRALYVNDPTSKLVLEERELPTLGVTLKTSVVRNYSALLSRLTSK